jgi:hypothetical protein
MAKKIFSYKARTMQEIENYINLLPVPIYILGQPQQVMEKGKQLWVVWFSPLRYSDERLIDNSRKGVVE